MSSPAQMLVEHLDIWTGAIKRKSGAGRGNGGKLSLYGIEVLRSLIRNFAVRGRLVPQAPSDEPASELLKRLGFRPRTSGEELPEGWSKAPLTVFGDFTGGLTPSKSVARYWGNGISWVSPKDMGTDTVDQTEDQITQDALDETNLQVVPSGSLLMVARSGILRRKFPVSIASIDCTINQDLKALLLKPGLDGRYLQVMLQGFQPRILTELVKRGMTVESLIFADFTRATWPIPPLAEQERIVAKVDGLMALCDALEAGTRDAMAAHETLVRELLATLVNSQDAGDLATNWSCIEANFDTLFTTEASIDALKQTILELAVRGKLVRYDGKSTGSELLHDLRSARAQLVQQGKAKKNKTLTPVDEDNVPFAVPSHWTWARFSEMGIFERGKSKHRPRNDPKLFEPGIYPLVQTGEVARAGDTIQESYSEYSEFGLAQSRLWPKGTLCITIAANIADSATLGFDACFPDSVVGFLPAQPIESARYFLHFMKTAKADLLKFAPATAQRNINLGILETVMVPLPPLDEMQRIVETVDNLHSICNALTSRLEENQVQSAKIADTLCVGGTA